MALLTDSEKADRTLRPDGQQKDYVILSEEERARGFVRPVRTKYKHVGIRPKHPLRDLTDDEKQQYVSESYVAFESYPESESSVVGRFWTQEQLNSGCGAVTSMPLPIAETYARNPKFYGATFCCTCGKHLPVEEFVWIDEHGRETNEVLGS